MRVRYFLIGLLGSAALAAEPDAVRDRETVRTEFAAALIAREARQYTITVEGTPKPLVLEPNPLLKTSSPVMGSLHGGVYVWTDQGRPRVIAHVYKWFEPHKLLGVAFHSLTSEPLRAERDEKVVWAPTAAGSTRPCSPPPPSRRFPQPPGSGR